MVCRIYATRRCSHSSVHRHRHEAVLAIGHLVIVEVGELHARGREALGIGLINDEVLPNRTATPRPLASVC